MVFLHLQAINQSPDHKISTISKYWIIGDKVDQTSLRKVVREFCNQHPVYRLEEHISDSVSVARGKFWTQRLFFFRCVRKKNLITSLLLRNIKTSYISYSTAAVGTEVSRGFSLFQTTTIFGMSHILNESVKTLTKQAIFRL